MYVNLVKGTHARPLEQGSGSDLSTHWEAAGAPSIPCPASNLIFNNQSDLSDWLIYLINSENVSNQKYDFERRLCAQTQDLQILKKFYVPQMNPKEFFHNTAYSV